MEWLLLLLLPVVLLIWAVHLLQITLLWRESKDSLRRFKEAPRGARIATVASLGLGIGWSVVMIRAFEGHGRQTVGYVLLGIFGTIAVVVVLALPVLVRREERARRARSADRSRGTLGR